MGKTLNALILISILVFNGCASDPKRPDGSQVRVSNDDPRSSCEQVDQVVGTSATTGNAYNNALADLKREAASKSANYVKIVAVSAHGSAIRGIGYRCP